MDLLDTSHLMLAVVGIITFAISGALAALRKEMDAVGIAALAVVTATGGGMIRDLLIGATPVAAMVDLWMICVAAASSAVVLFTVKVHERLRRPLLVFDAIGLGMFVVEGTLKGLAYGLQPLAAAFVGVITGVGGGIVRDVLASEVPIIFRRRSQLYVIPALAGALLTVTLWMLRLAHPVALVGTAMLITAIRVAALRWNLHLPGVRWHRNRT
ncbi:MAG: trimeric intracellular cation channel family protein [Propionibacteriaceae bacterium]|nr:trimeric intracellular cation channel family protein [Propionibacteriaceae bacterium]